MHTMSYIPGKQSIEMDGGWGRFGLAGTFEEFHFPEYFFLLVTRLCFMLPNFIPLFLHPLCFILSPSVSSVQFCCLVKFFTLL